MCRICARPIDGPVRVKFLARIMWWAFYFLKYFPARRVLTHLLLERGSVGHMMHSEQQTSMIRFLKVREITKNVLLSKI